MCEQAYWIGQADELPGNGSHLPLVVEGTTLLRRLEQENKVSTTDSVSSSPVVLLRADCTACTSCSDSCSSLRRAFDPAVREDAGGLE